MKTIRVLSPIKTGGKRQPVGTELRLAADEAAELERLGAVEILGDAEASPAAAPEAAPEPTAEPTAESPAAATPEPTAPAESEAATSTDAKKRATGKKAN